MNKIEKDIVADLQIILGIKSEEPDMCFMQKYLDDAKKMTPEEIKQLIDQLEDIRSLKAKESLGL